MTQASRSILIVSGQLYVGGMTQHMGEFAECASAMGHRVAILTPEGEGLDSIRPHFARGGAEVIATAPSTAGLASADIREAMRTTKPDWISLCTGALPPDTRTAWKLLRAGVPVIESVHVYPSRMQMKFQQRLFYAMRPKKRYRLLVINAAMRDDTIRLAPSLGRVTMLVDYGVELPGGEPRRHAHTDEPVCISFSRLDESHKDNTTLLRAWQRVHEVIPGAKLILLGDGPDRQDLVALTASLGLEDCVTFQAWTDSPFELVRQADVAVLSTKREGLPRVSVEAQALGLPVVITDAPGGHDAVEDGRTGLVVPVGSAEAMSDALVSMLSDHERRAALGAAGIERAQRFSIENYTRRILGIADDLIAS